MGACSDDILMQVQHKPIDPDAKIQNKFKTADVQDSDIVNPIEVHWQLRKVFPQIPSRVSLLITKFLDSNNDNSIDRYEFNRFLRFMERVSKEEDLIELIFRAADLNESGHIEYKELQQIQQKLPNLQLDIELYQGKTFDLEQFKDFMEPFQDHLFGFHDIWTTAKWGDGQKENQVISRDMAINMSSKNGSFNYKHKSNLASNQVQERQSW